MGTFNSVITFRYIRRIYFSTRCALVDLEGFLLRERWWFLLELLLLSLQTHCHAPGPWVYHLTFQSPIFPFLLTPTAVYPPMRSLCLLVLALTSSRVVANVPFVKTRCQVSARIPAAVTRVCALCAPQPSVPESAGSWMVRMLPRGAGAPDTSPAPRFFPWEVVSAEAGLQNPGFALSFPKCSMNAAPWRPCFPFEKSDEVLRSLGPQMWPIPPPPPRCLCN